MQEENVELQYLVELSAATTPTTEAVPDLMENKRPIIKRYPYFGLVLATLSSLSFSLCTVIVKILRNVNPIQLVLFGLIGIMMPSIPILVYTEQPVFPKGSRWLLVMRSIVGTMGMMCSFYAFKNMPLGEAAVIVFSVPALVKLLARKYLNEPYGLFDSLAVFLTLIGVIIIITYDIWSLPHSKTYQLHEYNAALGLAGVSTIFSSTAYVLLRLLKGLHHSVIMTNFGVIGIILTLIVLFFFGTICMPVCGTEKMLIVGLALFSYLGQRLLTMALQMEQAGPVAIARSANILFAFLWQLLYFNEMPAIYALIGGCLVTISIAIIGLRTWAVALPPESQLRAKLSILYR